MWFHFFFDIRVEKCEALVTENFKLLKYAVNGQVEL